MKTAIEQLIDELEKDGYAFNYEVLRIYVEKEKQQIVNARIDGVQKSLSIPKIFAFKKSEEYYYSTFGDKVEEAGI